MRRASDIDPSHDMKAPWRPFSLFCLTVLMVITGCGHPSLAEDTASEGVWTPFERKLLQRLWLDNLPPPPADPSNRYAEDPEAADLGEHLFYDTRLSDNQAVSCATCHQPENYFTDGLPRSKAIGETRRGAPSLIGTAYSAWLYWDGRRDSHWSQALTPLETPAEHGFDRHRALDVISQDTDLRSAYEKVFGALPGEHADEESIDHAFANFGKAIAAFERRLLPTASRFDRYVGAILNGSADPETILDPEEIAGLKLFLSEKAQCTRCHSGPLFTNFGFHNIGLIELKRGVRDYDFGRVKGIKEAIADPFRCDGPYSDAGPGDCLEEQFVKTKGQELAGAFKVPTLRNVAETAPYMHDGRFPTLHDVLAHYREAPKRRLGHQELNPLDLSAEEVDQLVAFLGTLTGPPPAAVQ